MNFCYGHEFSVYSPTTSADSYEDHMKRLWNEPTHEISHEIFSEHYQSFHHKPCEKVKGYEILLRKITSYENMSTINWMHVQFFKLWVKNKQKGNKIYTFPL